MVTIGDGLALLALAVGLWLLLHDRSDRTALPMPRQPQISLKTGRKLLAVHLAAAPHASGRWIR